MADPFPDRLSVNPASPHYNEDILRREVGIRFNGVERDNVEEGDVVGDQQAAAVQPLRIGRLAQPEFGGHEVALDITEIAHRLHSSHPRGAVPSAGGDRPHSSHGFNTAAIPTGLAGNTSGVY